MPAIAYPFLRIHPAAIIAEPWTWFDDPAGGLVPDALDGWEQSRDLMVRRRLRLDWEAVARNLGHAPEGLRLEVIVTVGTGGPRADRRRLVWWRCELSVDSCECSPAITLTGSELSQGVMLRTEILLHGPEATGPTLSPGRRGMRLWEHTHRVLLEPVEPRFSVQVTSFAAEFPGAEEAFWRLDWTPEDPVRDFGGSVRLWLNSDFPEFVQRFSGDDEITTRSVMWGVISQVVRATLANDAYSPDLVHEAPTSIGAAVTGWLDRAFPGQDAAGVTQLLTRNPAGFEAALAMLTRGDDGA